MSAEALLPLAPDVVSVGPWLSADVGPEPLLRWLGRTFSHRPLLGITGRPLDDDRGTPLRGLSALGSGVALVSTRGLCDKPLSGVVIHEVAHSLGMEHCDRWDCALSERPFPLDVGDRPESLCPRCRFLWESRCLRGVP